MRKSSLIDKSVVKTANLFYQLFIAWQKTANSRGLYANVNYKIAFPLHNFG